MSSATLLPGAEHFRVEELPAYPASGEGDHLLVEIERRGLTTDAVADLLARTCRRPFRAVGFAGRKDRHAIARQWFSIEGGREEQLESLGEAGRESLHVLRVTRHRHALRLGDLTGNRFVLELSRPAGETFGQVRDRLESLERDGLLNRFGDQRFGVKGSTLATARALARDDLAEALRWVVDASGRWSPGDPLPRGRAPGAVGRVRAALARKPDDLRGAWAAAGSRHHGLIASAAQSAIFNAVLEARQEAGLVYRLRAGDLACGPRGREFVCLPERVEELCRLAAPGVLQMFATGPLPGTGRPRPSDAVLAEERAWSASSGVSWDWLGAGGALRSRGARRRLVVGLLERPTLEPSAPERLRLSVALPPGSYATELLGALDVAVPEQRGELASTPQEP